MWKTKGIGKLIFDSNRIKYNTKIAGYAVFNTERILFQFMNAVKEI